MELPLCKYKISTVQLHTNMVAKPIWGNDDDDDDNDDDCWRLMSIPHFLK